MLAGLCAAERLAPAGMTRGIHVEFFAEYAGFLARTVTVLVAILVVLAAVAALRGRNRRVASGHLDVRKLNDFYKDLRERLEHSVLDKARLKSLRKAEAKAAKQAKKSAGQKSRVFVLDFDGDSAARANRRRTSPQRQQDEETISRQA